jgi:AraC-like DNA-binding protein
VLRHNISVLRQGCITEYDPRRGVSVSTLAYEYPRGYQVPAHSHGSDQLIYAIGGVMEVSAGQSVWLIPPYFALWIPARTTHSIRMPGVVSMRTLYLRRGLATGMPSTCAVFHVTPLLRELIVEAVRLGQLRTRNRLHCSLRDVLLSRLLAATPTPTSVTLPRDPRARAIADAVIGNPGERRTFAELCAACGAGVRTMQRLFPREVGSDFEVWRRQVRLMKAVDLLVAGRSVKEASAAVGYRQPTAFVQMFRAVLGTTPKAWIQALERLTA